MTTKAITPKGELSSSSQSPLREFQQKMTKKFTHHLADYCWWPSEDLKQVITDDEASERMKLGGTPRSSRRGFERVKELICNEFVEQLRAEGLLVARLTDEGDIDVMLLRAPKNPTADESDHPAGDEEVEAAPEEATNTDSEPVATKPNVPGSERTGVSMPEVVMIDIDELTQDEPDRPLRHLEGMADSISVVGLLGLPVVRRDPETGSFRRVAGARRAAGCKKLGWQQVPCIVVPLDGLRAELAALDENLVRQDLTALQRAERWRRRKEIYEQLYPSAVKPGGGRRKNGETISPFSEDSAEKVGVSQRSIQQYIQIAQKLTDETKQVIRGSILDDCLTDLLHLARIEPELQLEQVQRLIAEREAEKNRAEQADDRVNLEAAKGEDSRRVEAVMEYGTPELVETMDNGTISVSAAAEAATVSPEGQEKAAEEMKAGKKPRQAINDTKQHTDTSTDKDTSRIHVLLTLTESNEKLARTLRDVLGPERATRLGALLQQSAGSPTPAAS